MSYIDGFVIAAPTADKDKVIDALTKAGFEDYHDKLPYDRGWIYRAVLNDVIVDTIWQTPNRRSVVDEEWFKRGAFLEVFALKIDEHHRCHSSGAQALSRSLFATLIPRNKAGQFFGFFAVVEKFAGIIGPLVFGAVIAASGSSRGAILSIIAFFIIGGIILAFVNVPEGQRLARAAEKGAH